MTRDASTLHQRIIADVEARIRSGEWRPGHRIPYEHEFVAQYGCARATVSKALQALTTVGFIERRKKAGSFVAQPQVHAALLGIPDIRRVVTDRGEDYSFRLLARSVEQGSDAWKGQAPACEGPVLRLEGLHFAGARPLAVEHREISLAAVPEAEPVDFASEAPGSWLLEHIPWTDARHRIAAVGAGPRLGPLLDVDRHQACLQVERWTWQVGRPITFARQTFPGDRYDLIGDLTPGRG